MHLPASPRRCLAILMLRTIGLDQKSTARLARCADETVVFVDKWAREADYADISNLCDEQAMKQMMSREMAFWEVENETLLKLDRITGGDILLHYRKDYVEQKTKGTTIIVETVTIQPSQKGFTNPESLVGAKYLDISISYNDLWIDSVAITTSHPKAPYKFLIFDRKQPEDFYNEEDIFWEEECYSRRTQYVQPQPKRYHDADECKHLHCGLEHEGHPRDFGMDEQELQEYFRQPVTYTVRLEYKLSF